MPSVNIRVTNTKISPSIREYLNSNIGKLSKFLREENTVHVELEQEGKHRTGLIYKAEITIMPKSEVYAEAHGADFYEAIDLLIPKAKEQLTKLKDKRVSLRRRARRVK